MNYYSHNIGDYALDTKLMTYEEKGIYVDMLDRYASTGKPLDSQWIATLKRVANEGAVNAVLSLCFEEIDGFFHHRRMDGLLADYEKMAERNRKNGQKRVQKPSENPVATQSLPSCEPVGSLTNNHKPITNINKEKYKKENDETQIDKPESKRTKAFFAIPKPDDVPQQIWDDFLTIRKAKKAPVTETALNQIRIEAKKAEIELKDALATSCARGWQSFKAEWINNNERNQNTSDSSSNPFLKPSGEA